MIIFLLTVLDINFKLVFNLWTPWWSLSYYSAMYTFLTIIKVCLLYSVSDDFKAIVRRRVFSSSMMNYEIFDSNNSKA